MPNFSAYIDHFNAPNERLYIACFLKNNKWNCNSQKMNFEDSEKWLIENGKYKKSLTTAMIPVNCKFSSNIYTEIYVEKKLIKNFFEIEFIN